MLSGCNRAQKSPHMAGLVGEGGAVKLLFGASDQRDSAALV